MILRNKIIPIAIAAVLLGGTVGAFVSSRNSQPATTSYSTTAPSSGLLDNQNARLVSDNSAAVDRAASQTENIADSASYRMGFTDGFLACRNGNTTNRDVAAERTLAPTSRVVYRDVPVRSRSYSRYDNSRQVYYDYSNQPRQRTFWQKHRDKLTVAMGTGGGALLGALIGGHKGAAIGALAGGGGSAIWTYGIRKRNRTY
ncbi:MAG: hypothetical protein DMF68_09380 [Acidobacteria bacterium]|nr:MAG: hypothetical protein DMF68_09380 [Acidobacteriota bacterium]